MDYEEFRDYIIEVKEKFIQYREQIETLDEDIVPDLPNIEFIFRLDMMDHVLDELSDMERLINE